MKSYWFHYPYFFMWYSFVKHSKVRGAYCLGVFQNGKDPTTLLGGNLFTFGIFVPFHALPCDLLSLSNFLYG